MSETVNIGEISNKLSNDIFKYFLWKSHPIHDENFKCNNSSHLTDEKKPKQKATHPGDVVFYYEDPYLGKNVYLHTDLKSYGNKSIAIGKIRATIKSLAMTIECARQSEDWRKLYSIGELEDIEIRGLLFVHNHDNIYAGNFETLISKTELSTIPIAPNVYIHYLSPKDVSRLYTISNDMMRLQHEKTLPTEYSFYYPDLIMWRRHGDGWNQPAAIESLTAPYFIIKYAEQEKSPSGYLIYYNRQGATSQEFEYFIDSLSRYQMLEVGKFIRIRVVHEAPDQNFKSNFLAATKNYAKAWGFEKTRLEVLENIKIDTVTAVASSYRAAEIAWKDK